MKRRCISVRLPLTVALWLASGRAEAQVSVAALGAAAQPRNTAVLSGVREQVTGVWIGGMAQLDLGPVSILGTAFRGTLTSAESTPALDRDAGEIAGTLRLAPVTWIGLEGGYTVRAFTSAAGYQRWEIPSIGICLMGTLGHPSMRAFARGAYLPAIKVSGLEPPELGVAAEAGLSVAPRDVPLMLQLRYRLERYDFPAAAAARLEQFDEVIVALGFRFGEPQR